MRGPFHRFAWHHGGHDGRGRETPPGPVGASSTAEQPSIVSPVITKTKTLGSRRGRGVLGAYGGVGGCRTVPLRAWRLAGPPRPARQCRVYQHCPLPTPAERRCFLRTSLQPSALQGGQGRLVGMRQRQAQPWLHGRLPVRLTALRPLGPAPARALAVLAQRRGVSEADAAPVSSGLAEEPAPSAGAPAATPASPLVPRTGRHGASSAPKPLRHRTPVSVASTGTTRGNRGCACRRRPGARNSRGRRNARTRPAPASAPDRAWQAEGEALSQRAGPEPPGEARGP